MAHSAHITIETSTKEVLFAYTFHFFCSAYTKSAFQIDSADMSAFEKLGWGASLALTLSENNVIHDDVTFVSIVSFEFHTKEILWRNVEFLD